MTLHKIVDNKEILINKMYVGEYLLDNIGHEIINLIPADGNADKNGDGQNYIYINPIGTMGKEHNDRIDTVILVRNTGLPNTLEVLAQAWDLEQIAKIDKSTHNKEIKTICQSQDEYIKSHNVTYCGKFINEIFIKNKDNENAVSITFKANKLRRPKKKLYISFNKEQNERLQSIDNEIVDIICLNKRNNFNSKFVNIAKRSQKMYIDKQKEFAFKQLKDMLENETLWEDKNTTKNTITIKEDEYDEYNFIDLVDKQNAEVTYSNLFQHIFQSSPELFQKFAKEVLSKDKYGDEELNEHGKILNISQDINITREEAHIDLLIRDNTNKNIIVIENKLKSSINGKKYDLYGEEITNQLFDYYYYVQGKKVRKKYNEQNSMYAEAYIHDKNSLKKFEGTEPFFFIFAPDYNDIKQAKIIPYGVYKVINYSRIYEFYKKYELKYSPKIKYYKEFLYAISKHINNVDNSLEIEMHKKFAKIIENKQ